MVNNIENLKSLFAKVNSIQASSVEAAIIKKARDGVIYIENSKYNFAKKKSQKAKIIKDKESSLCKWYKTVIRTRRNMLERDPNLTNIDRNVLKYLDINPCPR